MTIDLLGIKRISTFQRSQFQVARYGFLTFVMLEWQKEIQRMIYESKFSLLIMMAWLSAK